MRVFVVKRKAFESNEPNQTRFRFEPKTKGIAWELIREINQVQNLMIQSVEYCHPKIIFYCHISDYFTAEDARTCQAIQNFVNFYFQIELKADSVCWTA